jgi:hypothetical protein
MKQPGFKVQVKSGLRTTTEVMDLVDPSSKTYKWCERRHARIVATRKEKQQQNEK